MLYKGLIILCLTIKACKLIKVNQYLGVIGFLFLVFFFILYLIWNYSYHIYL